MSIPSDDALWAIVQQAVLTVLSIPAEQLQHSTLLKEELGADSLGLVELVEVSEEQLRRRGVFVWVEDDTLSQLKALGDLVSALRTAKEK
jgi:acyl carrier protein